MKIAKLNMDAQDKTRFEIQGKSSVKYHLKANHVVEAKRWFWTLNNAIQWAKDEAKEEEKRQNKDAETLRQAKLDQSEGRPVEGSVDSQGPPPSKSTGKGLAPPTLNLPNTSGTKLNKYTSRTTAESAAGDEEGSVYEGEQNGPPPDDVPQGTSDINAAGPVLGADDDEYDDEASSREPTAADKDALNITAQSAKLQLELLAGVSSSLQSEKAKNPDMKVSDPTVDQALVAYDTAVGSLKGLVQNLLRISRDRDSYWRHRLDREAHLRNMWEDSIARVAQEHDELQSKMGESEEKRRRTKKALKEALEGTSPRVVGVGGGDDSLAESGEQQAREVPQSAEEPSGEDAKKTALASPLYESDEDEEDEFFDALDAGEIEAEDLAKVEEKDEKEPATEGNGELRAVKYRQVEPSFKGYEEPIRKKLKMDYDNRPKLSLWVSGLSCNLPPLPLEKLYADLIDHFRVF